MTTPARKLPTRVLCVDDHAFLVDGLRARLEIEPDMEFAGRLGTADDLVDHVRESRADVVLLDIEMPGADVFEAIHDLRRRCPEVKTILLSAHVRDQYLDSAFAAGSWGYLTKSDSPEEVLAGIRKVTRGETAVSPLVLARRRMEGSKLALLTEREKQILRMIANGMSRKEIAQRLCRSPMTIDNHRKSILKKLEIRDRVDLVRYAIAEGLGEL